MLNISLQISNTMEKHYYKTLIIKHTDFFLYLISIPHITNQMQNQAHLTKQSTKNWMKSKVPAQSGAWTASSPSARTRWWDQHRQRHQEQAPRRTTSLQQGTITAGSNRAQKKWWWDRSGDLSTMGEERREDQGDGEGEKERFWERNWAMAMRFEGFGRVGLVVGGPEDNAMALSMALPTLLAFLHI